jgi:hypothetical protein
MNERTGVLLLGAEELLDLLTDVSVGDLHVVLGVAVFAHEGEEAIVGDVKLKENRLVSWVWK